MLTPSYVFTPSITSHFSFSHSLLSHHVVWFMKWVGSLTGQPSDVLCTISSPLKAQFSWAKHTRRAVGLIVFFFFITHTLCNCWRCVPGWEINLAMLYISLHFFHPRLHYEHDWHRQKNWDKKKQGCVIFFFCAVLFRWCASFTRIVGSGPLCFLFTTVT